MAGKECQLETLVKQVMEAGCQDGEGWKVVVPGKRRKGLPSPADMQLQSACSTLGTSLGSWRNPHRYSPCAHGWP